MTFLNNLLKSLGINSPFELIYNRSTRAALLDQTLYREIEEDNSLTKEALLIVIITSAASGLAAFITNLFRQRFGISLVGLLILPAVGIANYYLWAYMTQFVARNLFESDTDLGELLRILGYASIPRILSIFGFVPCFGPVLSFIGAIWALAAGYVGIKQAVDLDTWETILTILLGWLAIMIISGLITRLFGFGAAGLGPVLRNLGVI